MTGSTTSPSKNLTAPPTASWQNSLTDEREPNLVGRGENRDAITVHMRRRPGDVLMSPDVPASRCRCRRCCGGLGGPRGKQGNTRGYNQPLLPDRPMEGNWMLAWKKGSWLTTEPAPSGSVHVGPLPVRVCRARTCHFFHSFGVESCRFKHSSHGANSR
jgi:hypothetical protein